MFQSERERPGSKWREVDFHSALAYLFLALFRRCCEEAVGPQVHVSRVRLLPRVALRRLEN